MKYHFSVKASHAMTTLTLCPSPLPRPSEDGPTYGCVPWKRNTFKHPRLSMGERGMYARN